VVSPENSWRFNFLDYELHRPGSGAGMTENLVSLFYQASENADRTTGSGDSLSDPFWNRSMKQMLRNAIELVRYGRGYISLDDLYGVIQSAPHGPEVLESEAWQRNSLCYQCIAAGEERAKTPGEQRDFERSARYWLGEYPYMADKTRSSVEMVFTSMADCFLRGVLNDLFCGETNIVPELTHNGAVMILDLPVKEYGEVGRLAQVLFKLIWQRAIERRDVNQSSRPAFLWADESHNFLVADDTDFQTSARSARACTVYLTQNISNYYAVMGGQSGKPQVDSLLGCLQTKIFHANGDSVTNEWAADVIAKRWHTHYDHSTSFGGKKQEDDKHNLSGRKGIEYEVLPRDFQDLRPGGPQNGLQVDAILFQGNRTWQCNGKHFINVTFSQGRNA
jgi:hypothetical protein